MSNFSHFIDKLKAYMMPIAMLLGVCFHKQVAYFSFLVPYLIFSMLLFTYMRISWRGMNFTLMHLKLLVIQILGSVLVFAILFPFDKILAQGIMICMLAPTATSAPVIAGMLKGNVTSLISYSLVSNFAVVIVAPVFFSWIGFHQLPFYASAIQISQKVILLLIGPLFLAMLFNKFLPKVSEVFQKKAQISFYLWSLALVVVSGRTIEFIISQDKSNYTIEILLATFSFFVCVLQFWLGRKIGRKHQDTVAGGQGLGQKNTILAIWMAQVYLNPIASIGPGAYVLWQNIINSWQVWRNRKSLQ